MTTRGMVAPMPAVSQTAQQRITTEPGLFGADSCFPLPCVQGIATPRLAACGKELRQALLLRRTKLERREVLSDQWPEGDAETVEMTLSGSPEAPEVNRGGTLFHNSGG